MHLYKRLSSSYYLQMIRYAFYLEIFLAQPSKLASKFKFIDLVSKSCIVLFQKMLASKTRPRTSASLTKLSIKRISLHSRVVFREAKDSQRRKSHIPTCSHFSSHDKETLNNGRKSHQFKRSCIIGGTALRNRNSTKQKHYGIDYFVPQSTTDKRESSLGSKGVSLKKKRRRKNNTQYAKSQNCLEGSDSNCLTQKVIELSDILRVMKEGNLKKRSHETKKNNFVASAEQIDSQAYQAQIKSKLSCDALELIQKIKQELKANRQKCKDFIFDGIVKLNIDPQFQKQLAGVFDQKPQQICNFSAGFIKALEEQVGGPFSLQTLDKSCRSSGVLQALSKNIAKTKVYQSIEDKNIRDNFLSAVYANEYKKKNGSTNCRLKKILKAANCIL